MQGNTVGSLHTIKTRRRHKEDAYFLGLWCADGYYWSSSIGITNVDIGIALRSHSYLSNYFTKERIKIRIYYPSTMKKPKITCNSLYPLKKAKQLAYQVYVNSRPLLRETMEKEKNLLQLEDDLIIPYFAGRYDGDGSVSDDLRSDLRIAYSNFVEADIDRQLINRLGYSTKVYKYKKARTFVLYVSRYEANRFLKEIYPFSLKAPYVCPVETHFAQLRSRKMDKEN